MGHHMVVMVQVHYVASKNPLVMLGKAFEGMGAHHGERHSGGGGRPGGKPTGITGVPVSSVVCLQDGVMTCGLDGAVRFHELAADRLA